MTDPAVTFGLFDWVDADGVREPGQLYRERLGLLADAESAGFDIYHLAEHHGTPLGLVPAPSVFLAAAAVRTSRIRLCPLVYVLPLHNPARLAEEIAMLDQLSDGRLEVGFGKGGNPYELLAYGIEPGDAGRHYDEAFRLVMDTLRTGTIGGQGAGPAAARLPVRPVQVPHPPLWYPSSNAASVPGLGRRGVNTILGFSFRSPPPEQARIAREAYFASVAQAPPGTPMGGAGSAVPRFGMMRNIYVGESDEEAREQILAAMEVFYRQFTALFRRHGDDRYLQPHDFPAALADGRLIAGSAATVRDQLAGLLRVSGCNHFAGAFAFGSLSYAQSRASLRRFAEEVAPALRAS